MRVESQPPVAVVTGASSGIGAATSRLLAANGWRVVLVARRNDRLEQMTQEIGAAGGEAFPEALDAADGQAVLEMAARVRERWGVPSVVINSAGFGVWKFIEETAPAEIREMLEAPYLAAANCCRAFMEDFLSEERGHFIHIGSPASVIPWPGATAYTCSRWALRGLHEALSMDLAGTGVSSSMIYFGEVSSEYFEANPQSQEHIPSLAKVIPISTPEQCAHVVVRVVQRPRRVVYFPLMLRIMAWSAWAAPGPTRWLVARTGRRH